MITSALERLRALPAVFTLADLCRVARIVPKDGSVMLHRWQARALVHALSPKSGVYINRITAPDWKAHWPEALARALPSAIEVGETVLLQAGWTTQRPMTPAYAVLDTGTHARVEGAFLVDRPAGWYAGVHRVHGVRGQGPVPRLTPACALADVLLFGGSELWVPAPDDLYVDEEPAAPFLDACRVLAPLAAGAWPGALPEADSLEAVYEPLYVARLAPKA